MQKLFLASVAVTLCLSATLAQAAGFRFIEVPADQDGPALNGATWYPCAEPPGEIDLGKLTAAFKITVRGTRDCPISGDKLPPVVVSHGLSGDFTDHHDLAETLADAGFIVAAIDHPGHTSFDMSRDGDLSVFVERPTDIERLIDFMLDASPAVSNIDPKRIGFFGFSAGGYTGLVLIGANPDWAIPLCTVFHNPREPSSAASVCEQILRNGFRVQPLAHDARIKAAVIADPFSLWFTPDGFASITIPVQLWASESQTELGGMLMPSAESVAAVNTSLPAKHEYMWRRTPRIGHFCSSVRPAWKRRSVPPAARVCLLPAKPNRRGRPRMRERSARMRRALTALLFTSNSMRRCLRFFGHIWSTVRFHQEAR